MQKSIPLYKNKLFLIVVVIPTLISIIYFGFIASKIYVSESTLVIRTQEKSTISGLGSILQGVGFGTSQNDSYTVKDYILSRSAMTELDQKLNLKQVFSNQDIDPINRFGGLIYYKNNYEEFYKYYQKMVNVNLDPLSTILTLKTRAYTAQEAQLMNTDLLQQSEGLVNRLNERGQKDMIDFSQEILDKAEAKSKKAAIALGQFRNQYGVINPEQQSAIPLQQVAKLQDQLIATEAQILQIETVSKDNPQLPSLRQRAQLLRDQMDKENARIAGSGNKSLASKAVEYQRLFLDSQYADRELVSAMASLEQARTQAQRQHIYVERISQPNLPDYATEPKRIQSILATLLLTLMIFGILSILNAGVREHYDR
ncbi:MAG: capsule biosynthesis protein [Halothiobacillaceae bacterium]|nr:capsule biosynthesis protein [Halothiobacillaceae bacterium]